MRRRCVLALAALLLLAFSHASASADLPPPAWEEGRRPIPQPQQEQRMKEQQPAQHPPPPAVIIHPPSRPITHAGGLSSKSLLLVISGYRRAYVQAQVGRRPDEAGRNPGVCGDRSVASSAELGDGLGDGADA